MSPRAPRRWAGFAGSLALLAVLPAQAAVVLNERAALDCRARPDHTLACDYRPLAGPAATSAHARWESAQGPAVAVTPYPAGDAVTAVLFLIDTSDPARAPAVARAVEHVQGLVDSAPAHLRIGLASFDTDLYLLAPIGSSRVDLHAALATVRAAGKTTEMYRNVRDAARILDKAGAARRALVLLSDGLAEDFSYHHDDVIAVARAANIVIDTIGLPRSVPQSVALQSLRRLSDDTGGRFIAARPDDFGVPTDALPALWRELDLGGTVTLDLAPLVTAGAHDAQTVEVALSGDGVAEHLPVYVTLPPAVLPPASPAAPTSAPNQPVAPAPRAASEDAAPTSTRWFAVLAALLGLILLTVGAVYRRVRRGDAGRPAAPPVKPLAFVLLAGAPQPRHSIDRVPWRIGRGKNCDLVLNDQSVSRLHAEIRQTESGALVLHDLEALNGVFVNDQRIDSAQLREGDAVDIGDIRFTYTLRDENHAKLDATVVVRTRLPTTG